MNFNQTPNNFSYFSQQSIRGFTSSDVRRRELEFPRNHPTDVRGSFLRELEKERIRAELMAEDILRRRILEEEVRRDLMFERELWIRRGELDFGIGRSRGPPMQVPLLTNIEHRGGFETMPFQRDPVMAGSRNGVISHEVKEVNGVVGPTEGSKDKVIILAKPSANLADIKRKAMAQPVGGAIKVCKKQKTNEGWSCALCRITVTSERGLNEHLQGKKHKNRERGMVSQRTGFGCGSTPSLKKDGEVHDAPTPNPSGVNDNQTLIKSKKTSVEKENGVLEAPAKDKPKKKFQHFCELCQAGAYSLKVFNTHKRGKKHLAKLSELNKTGDASTMEASAQKAVMEEKKANKEAKMAAEESKEGTDGEQVETKGDDVDSGVNQIEDKEKVLETKGDDVGIDSNRIEDKEKVPETKGDDADDDLNRDEDKEKILKTKGDDVDSDVNRVVNKETVLEKVGGETVAPKTTFQEPVCNEVITE